MSRSGRHKDKYGNNAEISQDTSNDGTSARTRPFSFEDIMLRRKSKNAAGEIHSGPGDADNREDIVKKAADGLQSDRERDGKSTRGSSRHVLEDSLRVSSRRREDSSSMIRERKLVKDKSKQSQDDTQTKSKLESVINVTPDNARGGKSDRHVNHRKRSDRPNEDSKNESCERHSRGPVRKDISAEKHIRKSEKERELKESNDTDDKPVNKRRNVDQSRHDYENESHKRHSRSLTGTEKNAEGLRGQSEKERKKKHQDEDKEKIGDRDGVKKLDLRASKNSELSERKEKESSRMRYEESRLKRRRSRSRERDNDRGKRSPSLSPRAQKHTLFTEQEHGDLSSHSSKDRSQQSHADIERRRISSNGSNYRRCSGSSSGLGGYSPRKRKTEAAAKTPSLSNCSPERRTAAWDLPPAGKDGTSTDATIFGMQSSNQITSSNAQEASNVIPETSFIVKPVIMPQYTSSAQIHAIDSIQLTQATRPMRRLYVENLPASASEKALMECINNFLLSSGVNHIHGTRPCISCMIHKEKGQALLEFLTPEDASAALSFDGRSFYGSIIKIRRPKDFIEVTTGVPDKSVDVKNTVSDTVEDSSHKIFIGGISKLISSEMLIDIARAFGPLKAFHFEHDADIDAACAFLEYIDHLVTLKACAGLNGMKLGGQVLTVVQALPDTSSLGNASHPPFYGIPEHTKPLLEKPTEILKIKSALDPEGISLLSEAELEEILEDIRLECSRFGTVKAVNVVKQVDYSSTMESFVSLDVTGAAMDQMGNQEEVTDNSAVHELGNPDGSKPPNSTVEPVEDDGNFDNNPGMSNPVSSSTELDDSKKTTVSNGDSDDRLLANIIKDETCESSIDNRDMSVKDAGSLENSGSNSVEHANSPNSSRDQLVRNDKIVDTSATGAHEIEHKVNIEKSSILEKHNARSTTACKPDPGETKDSDIHKKVENKEEVANFSHVFEAGCVLVEFKRVEASCKAAHCLHGRLFDDRIVTVEYVAPYLYRKRFPK